MTRSGWLAVGAVIAALVGRSVDAWVMFLTAAAVTLGLIAAQQHGPALRATPSVAGRLRWGLLTGAGAVVLAVRLVVGGASSAPADEALPDGRGPWTAAVEAMSSNREGQQLATLLLESDTGSTLRVAATLPRFPAIEPGLVVTVDGSIDPPPPGPYGEYLRRIEVAGTLRSRTLGVASRSIGPAATLEWLRRRAGDSLAAAVPEPEAGLAAGIVIGLRDRVDRDLAADFTTVGASHVVAISGWNIAIVAATVAALAGRLGRRRRAVILVPVIVAYVLFAGGSPSVVRAAAMAGVVLLARETGRSGRASMALGWAAFALLIAEPSLVVDAGFQLSTVATAGILAWADPLERRLGRISGGRLPAWLAESLGVSLAAQAATLPIVLATFGRLALIAPVVNLAIVPLIAPAMAAALVALVGGGLALLGAPALVATLAGLPAWALLTIVCTIVRAGAALPIASLTLEPPWPLVSAAGLVLVSLLGVAVGRSGRVGTWFRGARRSGSATAAPAGSRGGGGEALSTSNRGRSSGVAPRSGRGRRVAIALVLAAGSLSLAAAHRPGGAARITVLDVGQGDAILVEGGQGGRMLVDGGPDPDRLIVELDRRLPPWDRRIDLLVLTHPHEDHVAGLPILLERYRVGQVFVTGMRGPGPGYGEFARDLGSGRAPPVRTLSTGGRFALDDIRLSVLWPDPGRVPLDPPNAGRAINDVSIVLLGEVAGRRFLLTGDVEDDIDPVLAGRGLPAVDILKVAHHGSATASTAAFLAEVRPRIAIVSSGAGNPYGHPARSTIDRLSASGAQVLRTDLDGSVGLTIESDGEIRVATSGGRTSGRVQAIGPPVAVGGRAGDALGGPVDALGGLADGRGGEAEPAPIPVLQPLPIPVVAIGCGIPSSG